MPKPKTPPVEEIDQKLKGERLTCEFVWTLAKPKKPTDKPKPADKDAIFVASTAGAGLWETKKKAINPFYFWTQLKGYDFKAPALTLDFGGDDKEIRIQSSERINDIHNAIYSWLAKLLTQLVWNSLSLEQYGVAQVSGTPDQAVTRLNLAASYKDVTGEAAG